MVAYVPKWHKKKIRIGSLLAGRIFQPSMKVHAWLATKNFGILGIAVSDMKRNRMVEFEQTMFAGPMDVFELPLTATDNSPTTP